MTPGGESVRRGGAEGWGREIAQEKATPVNILLTIWVKNSPILPELGPASSPPHHSGAISFPEPGTPRRPARAPTYGPAATAYGAAVDLSFVFSLSETARRNPTPGARAAGAVKEPR